MFLILDKPVTKRKTSLNTYLRRLCTRMSDGYYQCNICKTELRLTKDNLWTLRRHIAKKHPCRYDELMKQLKKHASRYSKNVVKENKSKYIRQQSWIKQYYNVVDKGVYKCNLCEVQLKLSYDYLDNMRRHIKELHQETYKKEEIKEIIVRNIAIEDEMDYVVEYIDTDNLENIECNAKILIDNSSQEANLNQFTNNEDSDDLEHHSFEDLEPHSNLSDSEPIKTSPELVQKLVNSADEIKNKLLSLDDRHLENKIKILCQTPVKGKRKCLRVFSICQGFPLFLLSRHSYKISIYKLFYRN